MSEPDGVAGWQSFPLGPGVLGMFTSRAGGASEPPFSSLNLSGSVGDEPAAVQRNRELVAGACGLRADQLACMHQVHGADVARVSAQQPPDAAPRADAIFTDAPGLALCVLVADCAPVLIADPQAGLVGAAHAGREGMAAGVVPALAGAMTSAGAQPARMVARIGPAICGGCYEVPADLRDRVAEVVPEAGCRTRAGTAGIDIRAGLAAQLARAGIRQVSADPRCTAETPGLYSYRRDGATGRFAGLVWLTP
ncbi:MAG TPA: peptidoglycan editing factor PgeF [Streptosporangiaceae bacterium]